MERPVCSFHVSYTYFLLSLIYAMNHEDKWQMNDKVRMETRPRDHMEHPCEQRMLDSTSIPHVLTDEPD